MLGVLADANLVEASDDPRVFVTFDSDAENDDGDDESEDHLEDISGADIQLPGPPQLRFDGDLVSAVGGMANIASGSLSDTFLKMMADTGWSDVATTTPYEYLQQPYEPRPATAMYDDYPNLYKGASGPTDKAIRAAATPSGAFFYFMQPDLWESIAEETNTYFREHIDERVDGLHAKQVVRERKNTGYKSKSKEKLRNELESSADITPRELCVFLGLLIARSIVPNKEKLAHHWRTTDEGAIPRGCFGFFMARNRFMHLSRNLHFSRNGDERAATDRAWKLRPVIDALQNRFAAGYTPPSIMAFDEAMLPSRSTFNRMRVYMKDKPHKWGTKLFMLCCSTTAYCIRYVGRALWHVTFFFGC